MKNKSQLPFLVILTGSLLLLGACKSRHGDEQSSQTRDLPPIEVSTVAVASAEYPVQYDVPATLHSRDQAIIASKVTGTIETMTVSLGQKVEKGELLVKINAREISARLLQAEAQMDQASRDLERMRRLKKDGAATTSELEGVEMRFQVASAVAQEASTMLGYTEIRAPFSGVITDKQMQEGDLATPGRPLLVLENPLNLRVEADIPEALIGNIDENSVVDVSIPALDLDLKGGVEEISPSADPVSRTFLVKISISQKKGIRSGQFARITVEGKPRQVISIPRSAVSLMGQMERVYAVVEGRAHLRLVKTGASYGESIEILSGLHAGEAIVAVVPENIKEGQPVLVSR